MDPCPGDRVTGWPGVTGPGDRMAWRDWVTGSLSDEEGSDNIARDMFADRD